MADVQWTYDDWQVLGLAKKQWEASYGGGHFDIPLHLFVEKGIDPTKTIASLEKFHNVGALEVNSVEPADESNYQKPHRGSGGVLYATDFIFGRERKETEKYLPNEGDVLNCFADKNSRLVALYKELDNNFGTPFVLANQFPQFDSATGRYYFNKRKQPIVFRVGLAPYRVASFLWKKRPNAVDFRECGIKTKSEFTLHIHRIRERCRQAGYKIPIEPASSGQYRLNLPPSKM